ncbi:hypothetical protein D3C72_1821630 [compost metagenome]
MPVQRELVVVRIDPPRIDPCGRDAGDLALAFAGLFPLPSCDRLNALALRLALLMAPRHHRKPDDQLGPITIQPVTAVNLAVIAQRYDDDAGIDDRHEQRQRIRHRLPRKPVEAFDQQIAALWNSAVFDHRQKPAKRAGFKVPALPRADAQILQAVVQKQRVFVRKGFRPLKLRRRLSPRSCLRVLIRT